MRILALILSLSFILSGCAEDTASLDIKQPTESSLEAGTEAEETADPETAQEPEETEAPADAQEEPPEAKPDQSQAEQAETALPSNFTKVTVTNLVDGDTADVQYSDGSTQRIRFIGVNTPETKSPTKGVEYYGQEASDYTKSSLLNKEVYLQKDVSETDKYGRGLRYVWLEAPSDENSESEIRSKMFNAVLVLNGYANVMTYPPDVKYAEYFKLFEEEARSANAGLWASQSTESSSSSSSAGSFEDKSATDENFSFMGNSSSMKLHKVDCKYAVKTSESNRVYFNTKEEAINAGYVPCKVCNP